MGCPERGRQVLLISSWGDGPFLKQFNVILIMLMLSENVTVKSSVLFCKQDGNIAMQCCNAKLVYNYTSNLYEKPAKN